MALFISEVTRWNHLPRSHTPTFQTRQHKARAQICTAALPSSTVTLGYFWTVTFTFETEISSHLLSAVCVGGMFWTQSRVLSHATHTSRPPRELPVQSSEASKAEVQLSVNVRKFTQACWLMTTCFTLLLAGGYFTAVRSCAVLEIVMQVNSWFISVMLSKSEEFHRLLHGNVLTSELATKFSGCAQH